MQKIKTSICKKLISEDLTETALCLMLYIAGMQDEKGLVVGVHYKEMCRELGFAVQTFYNALYLLKEKGFIDCQKNSRDDLDVRILNNDFSDRDFSCGYLSLRSPVFDPGIMRKLKAREIQMLIDLTMLCRSNGGRWMIGKDMCYKRYQELFGVSARAVQKYLHAMKKFFDIFWRRSKSDGRILYIFSLKRVSSGGRKLQSDEKILDEHFVKVESRRHRIKDAEPDEIRQTAALIRQYKAIAERNRLEILTLLRECIEDSLAIINEFKSRREKKEYMLRPKLIHKLLRNRLCMA